MPELHSSVPHAGASTPLPLEALARIADDLDVALGCECANPALQIDRWDAECAARLPEPS